MRGRGSYWSPQAGKLQLGVSYRVGGAVDGTVCCVVRSGFDRCSTVACVGVCRPDRTNSALDCRSMNASLLVVNDAAAVSTVMV